MQDTVALDGDGHVIGEARRRAADFLARAQAEHGILVSARAMDLTRLVVSELVTNARKYAPGPVLMELRIAGAVVEVIVWDSDPVLPVARAADAGRVGQHGLEIVMAVAQGFEVQREPVGKRITARIALTEEPGGDVTGRGLQQQPGPALDSHGIP
ncbi:ATP-binding protein [Streptomyces resistomycificus]|uniref:Regulator n=1 Tax=Streptomyces resistomycificus TaxID=67356 RepID=A0A0L8KSM4_9ACTN|nr:ATP-binding protein [Streptomyces resistomycificus]KOG28897.1 regulator [Streptomyces resistomycificus]KUN94359.1 regulator [Streptomyces resistomycificus]